MITRATFISDIHIYGISFNVIYDDDDDYGDLLYTNIIASAILEYVLISMLLIYNNNNI